jgi:hypothetical protein
VLELPLDETPCHRAAPVQPVRERSALFVRPDDDLERMCGGETLGVQRAYGFDRREHTQIAVEVSP